MDWLPVFDKNAVYIWAAYGFAFAVLGGLSAFVLMRARAAKAAVRKARDLEAQ
ncbi:MAG: heme exporter protein CcmD [Pseudomonadota bacterium]